MRKPSKQPRLLSPCSNPSSKLVLLPNPFAEAELRRVLCQCHNNKLGHRPHHHRISSSINYNINDEGGDSDCSQTNSRMILQDEQCGQESGGTSSTCIMAMEKLLLDEANMMDQSNDETLKHLHAWIILQLGSTITLSHQEWDATRTTKALCRCLDHFYRRFEQFPAILTQQEIQEAIHAIARTIWALTSVLEEEGAKGSQSQSTDFSALMKLVDRILLDGSTEIDSASLDHLHDLVLYMVDLSGKQQSTNALAIFLQTLNNNKCPRIAKSACIAMSTLSPNSSSRTSVFDQTNQHEKLFYWKCLVTSPLTNDSALLAVSNEIQAMAMRADVQKVCNTDETNIQPDCLLMDVADCLARIAKRRPSLDISRQALFHVLLESSCKYVQERALPGLVACHREESLWQNIANTLSAESVQHIISVLLEPCLVKSCPLVSRRDQHTSEACAVELLVDLLEHLTIQQLQHPNSSFPQGFPIVPDIMAICSVLLECENQSVVEHMITMLGKCVRQAGVRLLEEYPNLLDKLAVQLLCPFSKMKTKKSILMLISDLARTDSGWHLDLVRQRKVIDGLVAMSSSSTWEGADENGKFQAVALSLLFLLSANTANRRILAKRTGVLGVLIRAVRDMDQTHIGEHEALLGSREDMKTKIMVIAEAL